LRYAIIIFLCLFLSCGNPGGDTPQVPDDESVCIKWDAGFQQYWRVNIGGEEWEIDEKSYCLDYLTDGIYPSYVRGDGELNRLDFMVEVTPEYFKIIPGKWAQNFSDQLIFER